MAAGQPAGAPAGSRGMGWVEGGGWLAGWLAEVRVGWGGVGGLRRVVGRVESEGMGERVESERYKGVSDRR